MSLSSSFRSTLAQAWSVWPRSWASFLVIILTTMVVSVFIVAILSVLGLFAFGGPDSIEQFLVSFSLGGAVDTAKLLLAAAILLVWIGAIFVFMTLSQASYFLLAQSAYADQPLKPFQALFQDAWAYVVPILGLTFRGLGRVLLTVLAVAIPTALIFALFGNASPEAALELANTAAAGVAVPDPALGTFAVLSGWVQPVAFLVGLVLFLLLAVYYLSPMLLWQPTAVVHNLSAAQTVAQVKHNIAQDKKTFLWQPILFVIAAQLIMAPFTWVQVALEQSDPTAATIVSILGLIVNLVFLTPLMILALAALAQKTVAPSAPVQPELPSA